MHNPSSKICIRRATDIYTRERIVGDPVPGIALSGLSNQERRIAWA